MNTSDTHPTGTNTDCNVAILRGTATDAPLRRELSAGFVAQFDLATGGGSVPVAWHDPTDAAIATVVPGASLLVIGTVRRRFFRVGGNTQSRTEVVAERVVPLSRRKTVRSALAETISRVAESPGPSAASA